MPCAAADLMLTACPGSGKTRVIISKLARVIDEIRDTPWPFCHLVKGYKNGFKVLTPESPEFERLVTAVCAQHNRYNLTFKDFEDFTQLRVSPRWKAGRQRNRAGRAHACRSIRILATHP
jgi:DNA helicase-2/ATP-dependent DNA helicase PcrA